MDVINSIFKPLLDFLKEDNTTMFSILLNPLAELV